MMSIRSIAQVIGTAAVLLLLAPALYTADAADRPTPLLQLESPYLNEEGDAIVLSALL